MSLVKGTPDGDFFDQNPELKIISVFNKILDDHSKKDASKILWSVYLLEDPSSTLYRIPREDRLKEIQTNYYNFDPAKFKDLIQIYTRYCLSKEESLFKIQTDKLEELTVYLNQLNVDDDSGLKKTLEIMGKIGKIWDNIERAKKNLLEAQDKSVIRGGAKESAREKRKR